jgi:periplasmic mercuric ion binding protein
MKTMKKIHFLLIAALAIFMSSNSFAQEPSKKLVTKTETIKVLGNCEMCQARIEKAARIPGVTKASWNIKTKILTLVYNPSKVKSEDVLKKIAAAGHDAGKFKADSKAYNALPSCCKYK